MESKITKRKKLLKYTFLSMSLLFICCIFNKKECFAGGINSNEARVLGVARGTFEYDGETYVAKQEYVNQLIAKMSEDDFNLTAEQADEAINGIYANVETGVQDGYIVKVDSPEDNLDRNEVDKITETSPEEAMNEDNNEEDTDKEEQNKKLDVKENDNGILTVEDEEGNVVLKFEGELKNTGFSIHNTIILTIIIGVLLICVVVCSVKDIIVIRKK